MTLVSSLTSMAANVWNYFSIQPDPLWQRAMDEVGYREYLAFESSVREILKSVEEHISNKTILPHTLRTILLKQQEQLERFISPYFYDKKLKRLQNKLDCPKPFIDVIKESRARLKEKLATNPLIAKQSFYNDVINHLIKLSANLDLLVVNADDLADIMQYYQTIIPAEIFDPIKAAVDNNPITDQKNIEVVLKTVNEFFFADKAEKFSVVSNSVDQFRSRSPNLKQLAAALAWSYVGAVRAQEMGTETEFLKVFGGNQSDGAKSIMTISSDRIIIGGSTTSFGAGSHDGLLSMFSGNGSLVWAYSLGGSYRDVLQTIAMTPADEILAVGVSESALTGRDAILKLKFSVGGDFIFAEILERNSVLYSRGSALALTPEGGTIIVGITRPIGGEDDILLDMFDPNGLPIWSHTIDGNRTDLGRAVALDPNTGNIKVLSDTNSFGAGNRDLLFTIFNENGTILCACTLGGIQNEYGTAIMHLPNGDSLVLGFTNSFGDQDILIASISDNCTVNAARTFGDVGLDYAYDFMTTPTGNIFVVGKMTNNFIDHGLIFQLYDNLTIAWARKYEVGLKGNSFYGITTSSANEILVAGETRNLTSGNFAALFGKLDAEGNIPGCNISRSIQLTVLDWYNITVKNVTSDLKIINSTISVYNFSTISVKAITPEEYFSCPSNPSVSTSSSSSTNVPTPSSIPSTSQSSQTTTPSAPSSSSTNPTSSTSSQTINTINFTVQVSQEIILIESEGDPIIILSSTHLSVIGDVDLSNVIYTVSGNMPDWVTIYVDGVMVTQFTQEDVEGGFVSFQLNGIPCGDQYSLPLKVNGADVDADLIFQMDTCSTDNAPRLSDGFLISSKMLPIFGFLARTREQPTRSPECSEAEPGKGFPVFR